ncbi:MAG TPA: inositol monophosphatase [Planctomycetaceae bacterium]|nr:inositol monophosphatase [Planctomycetaceae bacterium]
MKLNDSELTDLARLAVDAATAAGQMIARTRPSEIDYKAGATSLASQVVTEVDRRSEAIILDTLQPTLGRFNLGLLTEEQPDDGGRFSADYFWCIDPIDGTLPFIEGTPGYAVSIALIRRDGVPTIGVVYDPVEETVTYAIANSGAYQNGRPWTPQLTNQTSNSATVLSLFTDRSFLSSERRAEVTQEMEAIADAMGLAGLKIDASSGGVVNACKVLANPPACYVKLPKRNGGGSLWDYAATTCIFSEVGAVATDLYGERFDLNRTDSTLMCHRGILYASNEDLAQRLRAKFG